MNAVEEWSLGDLLLQVGNVQSLVVPSSPGAVAFRRLWHGLLDRAYAAPATQVLDLLILNREVVALAPQPVAGGIRQQALANTARLTARLGEPLPESGLAAVESPAEKAWLEWCCWWFQGRRPPAPSPDWDAPAENWRVIREGCQLLSQEDPDPILLAAYSRAGPGEEENVPLSLLRRLVRLTAAEYHLERGHWEEARQFAEAAGPDGERLAQQAKVGAGQVDPVEACRRARYRAYRARRLANRLEMLSFLSASSYWYGEARAWKQLADHWQMEVQE